MGGYAGRVCTGAPLPTPLSTPCPAEIHPFVWSTIAPPDGSAWRVAPANQSLMLSAPAWLWAGGLGTGPSHTQHILPLHCGLRLPELRSTGSFEHGWPNGILGQVQPQGEQEELLGDYMISVSVRLQEERGRVREWVGRCQAPHFPQCWQKATVQNSPAGRHKSPPPMGCAYLHVPATPVGLSMDKGGLQNGTLPAGGLS